MIKHHVTVMTWKERITTTEAFHGLSHYSSVMLHSVKVKQMRFAAQACENIRQRKHSWNVNVVQMQDKGQPACHLKASPLKVTSYSGGGERVAEREPEPVPGERREGGELQPPCTRKPAGPHPPNLAQSLPSRALVCRWHGL